jgi:hypothetical protein
MTRCEKDHVDDPTSFVSSFHSESTWINIFQSRKERNLKRRNESSKQREENQHASNLSLIILDEHKNPHSNLYLITRQRRFPGGMIHGGTPRDSHRRDPYHVVSDYWIYHCEYFQLIDLQIVLHRKFSNQIAC